MPWIFDAPIQASGSALKWFIDTMAGPEKEEAERRGMNIYAYLNELALEAEAGSGGLLFFPYLQGERAPLWNNYASGMFIGMRLEMTRAQLTRSIFEGTAYALRHVIETLKEEGAQIDCLRICGGGARSRTWNMIKASVLNLPVYVLNQTSGDVPVGDALMAADITDMFQSLEEGVAKSVKVDEVIQPDPEWVKVYDKLYPYYVKMYQSLDQDLKSLDGTLEEIRAAF
jgi:xylulokinase